VAVAELVAGGPTKLGPPGLTFRQAADAGLLAGDGNGAQGGGRPYSFL